MLALYMYETTFAEGDYKDFGVCAEEACHQIGANA